MVNVWPTASGIARIVICHAVTNANLASTQAVALKMLADPPAAGYERATRF